MKFNVFRATRNVLPNQICEFYAPRDANYRHGQGMYFAFDRKYSEQFLARSFGYAVLGAFLVEVNTFIEHTGSKYLVPIESDLGKMQQMYESLKESADRLYASFNYKNVLEDPRYKSEDSDLQNKILSEAILYNDALTEKLQSTKEWQKYQELKTLQNQIFLEFENELSKVDAVINTESPGKFTGELVLKGPQNVTLIEFDVYCPENLAQKIYAMVKCGEISDLGIMKIPGEYADAVALVIKQF
jgi:hypothetical protein